jgi:hypothetical protein
MTPDLQMRTEAFFIRAGAPPADYGLAEAMALLAAIDAAVKPPRPSDLSINDGKLMVTLWPGNRMQAFHLSPEDFRRPGAEVARDIVRMAFGGRA